VGRGWLDHKAATKPGTILDDNNLKVMATMATYLMA
jgi:hypothetical protein